MDYRNGYRPGGSTKISDPKSTLASGASTHNEATSAAGGDDQPTPHEASEWRRTQKSNINSAIPSATHEPRLSSAFLSEGLLHKRERICQISSVSRRPLYPAIPG